MKIPTMKIVNKAAKDGFGIINEADFDAKVHTKYGAKPIKVSNPPRKKLSLGGMKGK